MCPEALTGVELMRRQRRIEPFVWDYFPDDENMSYPDRVDYLRILKDGLGVHSVRTEFRMKKLINPDGSFNDSTATSYRDSLKAMKEAGLGPPSLALFTPAKWMEKEARANPEKFFDHYRQYAQKVRSICQEAGVEPKYLQVMQEINTRWQTGIGYNQVLQMFPTTRQVFARDFPNSKIMTTILTSGAPDWREFTEKLVKDAGESLDAVGFDHYPGVYKDPAGVPLIGKKPFEAFGDTEPYEWIAQQKTDGILKGKNVLLTEVGVPAITSGSRFQRFGYDRIIQALDHFLLSRERKGETDTFSDIGFFTGGYHKAVDTKTPGGLLDFKPWTLVRKDKDGHWTLTNAGTRIKHLIQTRINPSL